MIQSLRRRAARSIAAIGLWAIAGLAGRSTAGAGLEEDYNQWKQALGTNLATAAEQITTLPGFQVQLLRSASRDEGSWVALTFDPKGRIIIAREDRLTLDGGGKSVGRIETINTNLLECRGLLFAHGALYANANNSKALVRLRDTDGDDRFDDLQVLRSTPGGVGHGRNQLALGPDGMIYSIHGDDVQLPTNGAAPASPLRHYNEDRLLPCDWDRHLFNAYAQMPYGHLIRTDADGKRWELVAGGLRNPFGIDFNAAGDLFTFDADMEWDVGLSWYHPTRVLHLIPGGDYGWRRGTGVLPVWSPDTLPSVVDIGLSSPTAIKFATKSNWPEPWRSALLILDWAYGKVHAVHLQRAGPTYRARTEVFLKGRPLNVTGLDFGPDGAMYFTTGGRRTQSGLYRVTWNGPQSGITKSASAQPAPESLKPATSDLWTRLNDPDHWVRYTARVELESKPVGEWSERACSDPRPFAGLTALLALSRCGESALQPRLVQSVLKFAPQSLTPEQQLIAIRALAVCFIRMGTPDRAVKQRVLEPWDRVYPTADSHVNQSLCELLVYLGSSNTVRKTLPLLASAATQEEKFHYLFTLRLVTNGWTLPERATYFDWLRRARTEFKGANMLPTALNYIRADAEATLSPGERAALGDVLAELSKPAAPSAAPAARAFVKEWTMKDFDEALRPAGRAANLARGQRMFNEIGCAQCHRLGGEGGFIGPDLTAVASRFDRRTLLESIVEPSKVVAEVYRAASITLKSGAIVDGRIVSEDAKAIFVAINPMDPDQRRRVVKTDIAARSVSELSPMPTGLLNTLARDEVLDLVAWIESGGTKPN